VKLVHLIGFITKKFVTMHSHMNVKFIREYFDMHLIPKVLVTTFSEEGSVSVTDSYRGMLGGCGSMAVNLYRTKRFQISDNCFQCFVILH